ncbi:SidA/IucD/PvdA family monooxygenase [Dickeya chrysanthemi]|uniref:SidA/IucD/PvdA family monooxygenase n=1 Tax=Dickeya chrysanthemi TaxID=556 RepID=UPI003015A623
MSALNLVSVNTYKEKLYDVIGIGFGPANIALAIALEESAFAGSCLFLERNEKAAWQPQMLLSGSDIQNNPCRDLVTPRNPRSRYTFINFLFEKNRLFEHLNLGLEFPLRREFAEYVCWVAEFFSHQVAYGCSVRRLTLDNSGAEPCYLIETDQNETYRARSVVVAPGRTPLIPTPFADADPRQVFHLNDYLRSLDRFNDEKPLRRIAVVGGSQSAVEIILHLRQNYPQAQIMNIQRGYGFRLKDTSPFSEHVYFPDFVDYYFNSSTAGKKRINQHLHFTNYSAADKDVIHQLYVSMYEDKLQGKNAVSIYSCQNIDRYEYDEQGGKLYITEVNTQEKQIIDKLDGVVLATGFRNLGEGENDELYPPLLTHLYPMLARHESGAYLKLNRDYSLSARPEYELPPIYLNGLCESSHGYGDAGSFSLLSLRSQEILRSLSCQLEKQAVLA